MFLSIMLVFFLTSVHVFGFKFVEMSQISRSKWLSLGGGVSIAFVFVHILPELHNLQNEIKNKDILYFLENHLYLIALVGILFFYGVEKGITSLKAKNASNGEMAMEDTLFYSHLGVFSVFNLLIGYYFHNELEVNGSSSVLTVLALGFHFLVNDYSLLQHHKDMYRNEGRWIMSAAVLVGWAFGTTFTIPKEIEAAFFAVVTGAIITNSFKEQLPEDKGNHFGFFLLGTVIFAVLHLL